jgi:hypothetical protein
VIWAKTPASEEAGYNNVVASLQEAMISKLSTQPAHFIPNRQTAEETLNRILGQSRI